MYQLINTLSMASVMILCHLFALQAPLAVPVRDQDVCESANGVWVEDGSTCAPCSQCRTLDSMVREETEVACTADCRATCLCPEGSYWYRNSCVLLEEITLCIEDQEIACGDAGGQWETCGSACDHQNCTTADGALDIFEEGPCADVCVETCLCPNQVWNGQACVDYEEVYPSCDELNGEETTGGGTTGGEVVGGETTGGEVAGGEATGGEIVGGEATGGEMMSNDEDNGEIVEESSCQQANSNASLWFFGLGLLLLNVYRRFSMKRVEL